MAAILYRYVGRMGLETSATETLDGFADGDFTSDYAKEARQWAVASGLFSGKGNNDLDPKGNATRAEVAALLTRFEALLPEEAEEPQE